MRRAGKSNFIKKVCVSFLAFMIVLSCLTESSKTAIAYTGMESTVTQEMCSAYYWVSLEQDKAGEVLMTPAQIDKYNSLALAEKDCNMNDLTSMDGSYDATKLRDSLANEVLASAPAKATFVNGVQVDQSVYYGLMANDVFTTAWTGNRAPLYALAVEQTQIFSVPTVDYIGYSAMDSDNEVVISSLRVGEPFVVKQAAAVGGRLYYFGYSSNVQGWVAADDMAVCGSKAEWLDYWQVDTTGHDFVVVTTDYFTLPESYYTPASSELKLTMGTVLKLVPESEIPESIGVRGMWNNIAVYIPTRDENGKCVRQIALIGQNKSVSIGYVPMTSANILFLSFEYLGDTYGWGGMLDSVDCSALIRNVYKCFGLEMPRNTNWQKCVPGTAVDISELDEASKAAVISTITPGTPLYMSGHTMIYLGTVDGRNYVISAMGSASDSAGELEVKSQNSVTVTPLTVRRRNGTTWLKNINTCVFPWCVGDEK